MPSNAPLRTVIPMRCGVLITGALIGRSGCAWPNGGAITLIDCAMGGG